MPKFRKGDICTIDVVVDSNLFGDSDLRVRQPDVYGDIYAKASSLTMKRPLIVVGDRVELASMDRFGASAIAATVKAIDGDRLWVERDSHSYDTWEVARVRRIDPDEPVASETTAPEPPRSDGGSAIIHKHTNIAGEAA